MKVTRNERADIWVVCLVNTWRVFLLIQVFASFFRMLVTMNVDTCLVSTQALEKSSVLSQGGGGLPISQRMCKPCSKLVRFRKETWIKFHTDDPPKNMRDHQTKQNLVAQQIWQLVFVHPCLFALNWVASTSRLIIWQVDFVYTYINE